MASSNCRWCANWVRFSTKVRNSRRLEGAPFLHRVRAVAPVLRTDAGVWLVTRHADALAVHQTFGKPEEDGLVHTRIKQIRHDNGTLPARDANGLRLPFRIRRAVGADTIEETTFDQFRINPKIDARRFQSRD